MRPGLRLACLGTPLGEARALVGSREAGRARGLWSSSGRRAARIAVVVAAAGELRIAVVVAGPGMCRAAVAWATVFARWDSKLRMVSGAGSAALDAGSMSGWSARWLCYRGIARWLDCDQLVRRQEQQLREVDLM